MARGINRQDIFNEDEDRQRYILTLQKAKEKSGCELYGYCLMDNHIHLLIKEKSESISQIMKRVGVSYAFWYNQKYERSGHVFQDRYKSEAVEDDNYFLAVLRYIHQNPLRAGMVKNIDDFSWSSHRLYATKQYQSLIDIDLMLGLLDQDQGNAVACYKQFMSEPNSVNYLESNEKARLTDTAARLALSNLLNNQPINVLLTMDKMDRDEVLRKAKKIEGISIRQIARISGIGKHVVANS